MRLVDVLTAHFRSVTTKSHVILPLGAEVVAGEEIAGREQQEVDYMNALVAEVMRRGGKYYLPLLIARGSSN